ncbi:hypothetical protein BsWGS_14692 [Bradybaena similaris]
MTEENNNINLPDHIEDGEDDALSMVDVLNEQTRLQADADAVLGGSDANHCTYPQGCIKRQALYACATCTPEGNAGICLACSYACHEGHELYELYTKRYFTCDCGNEKFGDKECKLYKGTKGLNADNRYSQNFRGVYCSCARPYPDPDDSVEDEMIQCIVCEDWYHERHLRATVPEDFHEMICPGCMSKCAFLWAYSVSRQVKLSDDPADNMDEAIDVCGVSGGNSDLAVQSTEGGDTKCTELHAKDEPENILTQSSTQPDSPDGSRKRQAIDSIQTHLQIPSPKKVKTEADQEEKDTIDKAADEESDSKICLLTSLQKGVADIPDSAAFWPEGWRSKLCQCEDCLQMYKEKGVEFLTDESDTVQAYEEKGRDSASNMSDEDSTATALAGMNRVQQIEVVRGFMDLKTELNGFLHGFAQNGKVVTETDIREFFQHMDQRRKDRMHVSQYTCR